MIFIQTGDILSVEEGVIGHGCNCSGGYGSGLAGQIAVKYPSARDAYLSEFEQGKCHLGTYSLVEVAPGLTIANMYTQQGYGGAGSKWADPDAILRALWRLCQSNQGKEIHVPRIGCGLGGLDWETEVLPVYNIVGDKYDFTVWTL